MNEKATHEKSQRVPMHGFVLRALVVLLVGGLIALSYWYGSTFRPGHEYHGIGTQTMPIIGGLILLVYLMRQHFVMVEPDQISLHKGWWLWTKSYKQIPRSGLDSIRLTSSRIKRGMFEDGPPSRARHYSVYLDGENKLFVYSFTWYMASLGLANRLSEAAGLPVNDVT